MINAEKYISDLLWCGKLWVRFILPLLVGHILLDIVIVEHRTRGGEQEHSFQS